MKRKGQVAMEFLMSYGWAILAAVIAIGALAYFGAFSPEVPALCNTNAPFTCTEHAIGTDIQMNLRNGAGSGVNVTSIEVEGCTTNTGIGVVADGDMTGAITFTCGLTAGDKVKKDIKINYVKTGGEITQIGTGSISGQVA